MRFSTTIAALVAIVAVNAAEAPAPPAYGQEPITSATTTHTITRTLSRVVETVTATRNGTVGTYESTATYPATTLVSAAPTAPGYGNATISGTGAATASASFYPPPPSEGGAGKVQAAGIAAVMGIIGMLAL